MSQKKRVKEIYKSADTVCDFDNEREKYLYQKYKHMIESGFLKRNLLRISKKEINVLDVACGTGRMLPEIFSLNKKIRYTGVDSSRNMAKMLIRKAKKEGFDKNVKIIISDASKMPFKDNTFDLVFSYHLLWHLPKKEQGMIIREMKRVVKPNGILIFDFLNRNFYWNSLKRYLKISETGGIYKLDRDEAIEIANGEVLEIEKICDAQIKNPVIYQVFNLINRLRKFLPWNMFHMAYLSSKK